MRDVVTEGIYQRQFTAPVSNLKPFWNCEGRHTERFIGRMQDSPRQSAQSQGLHICLNHNSGGVHNGNSNTGIRVDCHDLNAKRKCTQKSILNNCVLQHKTLSSAFIACIFIDQWTFFPVSAHQVQPCRK